MHNFRRRIYTADTCSTCGLPGGHPIHAAPEAPGAFLLSIIELSIIGRTVFAGARLAAQRIHAEGYRKPRILTTLEEVEDMPEESVVRTAHGVLLECDGHTWFTPQIDFEYTPFDDWLPATVLYDPREEAS